MPAQKNCPSRVGQIASTCDNFPAGVEYGTLYRGEGACDLSAIWASHTKQLAAGIGNALVGYYFYIMLVEGAVPESMIKPMAY